MAITVHLNRQLSPLGTGPIEPSAAAVGNDVFYPASGLFRLSSDAGATIEEPSYGAAGSIFPEGYADDFVDQSAIWNPFVGRFVWAMIRKPADGSKSTIRVAFTSKERFEATGARRWTYFDITSAQIGVPDLNFDYPQLTLGFSRLYLTAQLGNAAKNVVGAAMFRFSMAELERLSPAVIHFDYYVDRGVSNMGGAHRSGTRMYWAGHTTEHTVDGHTITDTLRSYALDENSLKITISDITIPAWQRDISSSTPDGSNWLSIEGGSISGACVGLTPVFAWTAGANPPAQPHAYIFVAQLEQVGDGLRLKGIRYIWNRDLAWAKPALGANDHGELGLTCAFGGAHDFVGTTIGFVELPISPASGYENLVTAQGSRGVPRWGDFMSIRNHAEHEARFIATGYTLQQDPVNPSATESLPRYTIFGRPEG